MNEKNYEKKLKLQHDIISRQSKQIEILNAKNEELELKLKEKDELINSVAPLRNELEKNVEEVKKYKDKYKSLIEELKRMKDILNQKVYKGRWWLIKLLMK